jgi:hypothetical protein
MAAGSPRSTSVARRLEMSLVEIKRRQETLVAVTERSTELRRAMLCKTLGALDDDTKKKRAAAGAAASAGVGVGAAAGGSRSSLGELIDDHLSDKAFAEAQARGLNVSQATARSNNPSFNPSIEGHFVNPSANSSANPSVDPTPRASPYKTTTTTTSSNRTPQTTPQRQTPRRGCTSC